MKRKATKKSRGPNAEEKEFMTWIKLRPCCVCHRPGPSIVHHCEGSTFKLKVNLVTVLLGHWFILPLCHVCDSQITQGSRKVFIEAYGLQSMLWIGEITQYPKQIQSEIIRGISGCNR